MYIYIYIYIYIYMYIGKPPAGFASGDSCPGFTTISTTYNTNRDNTLVILLCLIIIMLNNFYNTIIILLAIFCPFGQFYEIGISLLSL